MQSFDCTKYNRYGFTAKGQDRANVMPILCLMEKGVDALFKVSCTLAKIGYLFPILTNNRSKLFENAGSLFLARNANIVISFPLGNDRFPRIFDKFNFCRIIIGSYNPCLCTVAGDNNTDLTDGHEQWADFFFRDTSPSI